MDLLVSSFICSRSVQGMTGETDKVGSTVNRAGRSVSEIDCSARWGDFPSVYGCIDLLDYVVSLPRMPISRIAG